jgi:hypothetical protein
MSFTRDLKAIYIIIGFTLPVYIFLIGPTRISHFGDGDHRSEFF